MRGGKCQHWRGATRVPFFISWPGKLQPGAEVQRVTGGIDVFPTLAEIAGASVPDDVQGLSLLPLLRDPDADWPSRYFVVHRARWVPPETAEAAKYREMAVQSDRYRLCQMSADSAPELFDHLNDPGEKVDISAQHPEKVQAMLAYYNDYWAKARPRMINELSPEEAAKMAEKLALRKKAKSKKK
jgi:arylsulfatase